MVMSPRPRIQQAERAIEAATMLTGNKSYITQQHLVTAPSSPSSSSEMSQTRSSSSCSSSSSSTTVIPVAPRVTQQNWEYNPSFKGIWGEGFYYDPDEEKNVKNWPYYSICKAVWDKKEDGVQEVKQHRSWNDVVKQQPRSYINKDSRPKPVQSQQVHAVVGQERTVDPIMNALEEEISTLFVRNSPRHPSACSVSLQTNNPNRLYYEPVSDQSSSSLSLESISSSSFPSSATEIENELDRI